MAGSIGMTLDDLRFSHVHSILLTILEILVTS